MARTPNRRKRPVAPNRARAAAEARHATTRRRQRVIAGVVAALVLLSLLGALIGARSDSRRTSAPTSTTSSLPGTPATSSLPASGVAPVPAPVGASLTGPTSCPAEDGSSPRVTGFAEPPPNCIDAGSFYLATLTTTKGAMTFQLNPKRAPRTVNDFVVLARYHFYDGQPLTTVTTRASFTLGLAFTGGDGETGFPIPDEVPPQGQVFTFGMLAMSGTPGTPQTNHGQLLVATYENAAGIDQGVTSFGIMLAGDDTLAAIDALASQDGTPTEAVSITSITVVPGSAIPA